MTALPGESLLTVVLWVVFLAWLWTIYQYKTADKHRRDLLTDMHQLIHDGKVEADDLRRARDIPSIAERLNRSEDE